MTADTTTPLLKLLLQGTGNNPNAWGQNLNDQVITPLENAVAGYLVINTTGGTITLTDDQARYSFIQFSGVLTQALIVVVPETPKLYHFLNNNTGNFPSFAKFGAAGNITNLPRNCTSRVVCTGAVVGRIGGERVGTMFYHAGQTAPGGSQECTGAAVSRTDFVDLFNAIGTTWGAGDGFTTFNLPGGTDTGRFMRSRGPGIAVGTYQSNQNKLHSHTGSGTTSLNNVDHFHNGSGTTGTENQSLSHAHGFSAYQNAGNGQPGGQPNCLGTTQSSTTSAGGPNAHNHSYSFATSGVSSNHSHTYSFTTSTDGGSEARPESMAGMLCIWY